MAGRAFGEAVGQSSAVGGRTESREDWETKDGVTSDRNAAGVESSSRTFRGGSAATHPLTHELGTGAGGSTTVGADRCRLRWESPRRTAASTSIHVCMCSPCTEQIHRHHVTTRRATRCLDWIVAAVEATCDAVRPHRLVGHTLACSSLPPLSTLLPSNPLLVALCVVPRRDGSGTPAASLRWCGDGDGRRRLRLATQSHRCRLLRMRTTVGGARAVRLGECGGRRRLGTGTSVVLAAESANGNGTVRPDSAVRRCGDCTVVAGGVLRWGGERDDAGRQQWDDSTVWLCAPLPSRALRADCTQRPSG